MQQLASEKRRSINYIDQFNQRYKRDSNLLL